MRRSIALILGTASMSIAYGVAYRGDYGAVDKAAEMAKNANTRQAGLFALERLAEGKPEAISAELASQLGLHPSPPGGWVMFQQPDLRIYAIKKLGETGLGEALAYLSALKEEEFAPNPGERTILDQAVEVAKSTVQLLQTDRADQVQLLENWALDRSVVAGWAADQLCEMGSLISFSVVQQSIRARNRGDEVRINEDAQFCLQRMRILGSSPDRTQALSSVLASDLATEDSKVVAWAVRELLDIGSDDAIKALRSFSARAKAATGLPAIQPLSGLVDDDLAYKASQKRK
jgi:hypothetical protein